MRAHALRVLPLAARGIIIGIMMIANGLSAARAREQRRRRLLPGGGD